jgi:hypothetical protein
MSRKDFQFKVRAGQQEFERGVQKHRIAGLLARRQYGKTTIASRIAMRKMMKVPGHTVVFGSVKIDLGREIVRKEGAALRDGFAMLMEDAKQAKTILQAVDERGKNVTAVNVDDWTELYEQSRLEFRLFHDRNTYSRTKVVALTPESVGETGDLILDEVGRVRRFGEVMEAMLPIISSNPEFRAIFTTTPPPDDTHPSFELLAPPIGADLPVNPKGNWYRSEMGVWVLRITVYDAYADDVTLFDDDTGKPISPEESRRQAGDKDAWDRNYACKFLIGGTGACNLLFLKTAQERGVGQCECFIVSDDSDFDNAMKWLAKNISPNNLVGIGFDVATTTSETSNPSVASVVELDGTNVLVRAFIVWKTRDPEVARDRLTRIVDVCEQRPVGRVRALAIDATNEKYFAEDVRGMFAARVPVLLVVASEKVEIPGLQKPTNWKEYLGDQYVACLEDNRLTLPPHAYVRMDHRLVKKDRGRFVCDPTPDGLHGDTFDASKLGLHAVFTRTAGISTLDGIVLGSPHEGVEPFYPEHL